MINNRQGGRRRGRGGQRGQNQGSPGNRQDNRQRGNAAQLLEKYKSMARDAQLSGDRVQTEYYLQFADHYFRVLGESRSRYEDQRRGREDDDDDGDGDGDEEMAETDTVEAGDERPARRERPRRNDDDDRPRRRAERATDDGDDERGVRPQRRARPSPNGSGDTLSLNVLPPAIGRSEDDVEATVEAAPKRRRARKETASDEGDEVAPAA